MLVSFGTEHVTAGGNKQNKRGSVMPLQRDDHWWKRQRSEPHEKTMGGAISHQFAVSHENMEIKE
jgi:hypothetical protein